MSYINEDRDKALAALKNGLSKSEVSRKFKTKRLLEEIDVCSRRRDRNGS